MLTEGLPFQESANGIMKSTPSASSRHLPYQGRLSAFFCLSLPFSAFICPSLAMHGIRAGARLWAPLRPLR